MLLGPGIMKNCYLTGFERFGVLLGERFAYLEGSFFGFEEGGGRGGE